MEEGKRLQDKELDAASEIGGVEHKLKDVNITNNDETVHETTETDRVLKEHEIDSSEIVGESNEHSHSGESDEEASEGSKRPVHYVDEERLKDVEVTLTDEERQELKDESLRLKNEGNRKFKEEDFVMALKIYTEALNKCPLAFPKDRAILYSNKSAAEMKLGELSVAIEDCGRAVELDPSYVKALLRRAQMYETTDKLDEALEDYKKVLELDSANRDAITACMRLPDQINERNEKMKAEMMGKLKDLANLVLRPFSLSTDNFKMQQDPNTGSYSVNFQNNPK